MLQPAQSWKALLAIYATTTLIEAIGVSQVIAFLPARLQEVGMAQREVATFTGLLTAVLFAIGIVLVPFWGIWADKYSRRAVIARSAIVEAVVFAMIALAAEPWQLAVAWVLSGLQLGNTGVMLAALRDVSPVHRIGTVSAVFGATGALGFALGPALGGFMVDGLHWPLAAMFWSSALLSLAIVALLAFGSREVRPMVVPQGSSLELALGAVRSAIANPTVRRVFLIFGVAILGNLMTRPYVPLLVQRLTGSGPGLASGIGLVVGTAALIGALVSPVAGPLGDRIGLRTVLVGSVVLGGVMVAPMPLAPSVAVLAALSIVYSAAQASIQAMVFGLLALEVAPERRSATLNLVFLPLYVAGIIGPSMAAGFAATVGVPAVYPAAGAIMIASAVLIGVLTRRGGATTPPRIA